MRINKSGARRFEDRDLIVKQPFFLGPISLRDDVTGTS